MFGSGFSLGFDAGDLAAGINGFMSLAPVLSLLIGVLVLALIPRIVHTLQDIMAIGGSQLLQHYAGADDDDEWGSGDTLLENAWRGMREWEDSHHVDLAVEGSDYYDLGDAPDYHDLPGGEGEMPDEFGDFPPGHSWEEHWYPEQEL